MRYRAFHLTITLLSVLVGSCRQDPLQPVAVVPYMADTGDFVDARDGRSYGWIRIGDQWWMRDNLDWRPVSNDSIALASGFVPGFGQWSELDSSGAVLFGTLYSLSAMDLLDNQEDLCPAGWRLPDEMDLDALQEVLGGTSMLAGAAVRFDGPAALWKIRAFHWESVRNSSASRTQDGGLASGWPYSILMQPEWYSVCWNSGCLSQPGPRYQFRIRLADWNYSVYDSTAIFWAAGRLRMLFDLWSPQPKFQTAEGGEGIYPIRCMRGSPP